MVILVAMFVGYALHTELGTVGQNDPISHFAADLPKIAVFFMGLASGLLVGGILGAVLFLSAHFWWPARRAWKTCYDIVVEMGHPSQLPPGQEFIVLRRLWGVIQKEGHD